MDEFKNCFQRFRRQPNNPDRIDDLDQLVDFSNEFRPTCSCQSDHTMERVKLDPSLSNCYQGPLYTLSDYPGFLYAPNAMSMAAQQQLAYQAVATYCQVPHTTNIQLVAPKEHEVLSDMPMWDLWKLEHNYALDRNMSTISKPQYMSFTKLAWATMGYHYNWTARSYPATMASNIPSDLVELSQPFAQASLMHCLNVNADESSACTPSVFNPSAAIVNYYHDKSVMGPHRDDSEHAISKPIVSFSMGRPAVFLLGGDTKHDPVVAMLVRPGDVMIMGGASRLNYHCMARLLPARAGSLKKEDDIHNNDLKKHQIATIHNMPVPSGSERAALEQYLTKHRININLRQVYDD